MGETRQKLGMTGSVARVTPAPALRQSVASPASGHSTQDEEEELAPLETSSKLPAGQVHSFASVAKEDLPSGQTAHSSGVAQYRRTGQVHMSLLEAPATDDVPSGHAVHWSGIVRSVEAPYVPAMQSKAQPAKLLVMLPVVCIHLPSGQT